MALGQLHTGHAQGHAQGQERASVAETEHHGRLAGGEVTGTWSQPGSQGEELGSRASGRCWGLGWGGAEPG